jgi:hypothetical protein
VVLLNLLHTHPGFPQTSKEDQPADFLIGIQTIVLFIAGNRIQQPLPLIKTYCTYVQSNFLGNLSYSKNFGSLPDIIIDLHLV